MMVCSMFFLSACKSHEKMDGSDRDSHGCIPSAGYTWSNVRKDCIQVFNEGVRLNNAQDTAATSSAFVVFSKDSTAAEIFLPVDGDNPILSKVGPEWKNKLFCVKKAADKLLLLKNNKIIYKE
jgi:hypothetical protein